MAVVDKAAQNLQNQYNQRLAASNQQVNQMYDKKLLLI